MNRTTETGAPQRGSAPILAIAYFVLAAVGLVGTWYFNIQFAGRSSDLGYVQSWFVNPASSSAAMDIIVTAVAANVFFVSEGMRLGWSKWAWVFIPLTFLVALAFAFPLFLALREMRLGSRAPVAAGAGAR